MNISIVFDNECKHIYLFVGDPEAENVSVFSHFSSDWPGSGHDIIGVSNYPVDVADCMTIGLVMGRLTVKFKWPPVSQQWGWWANGAADSGFGGLMGWPTVGLMG